MAITREEAQNLGLVELYDEVKCLETLTEQRKIIEKLQDIGAKLLTEYEVQVGALLLEPLWIEAYYYRENVFEDDNCHNRSEQQERFGKLYFHKVGRGGFDVCLSNGSYSLSFLFKAFLADGKYQTQTGIYNFFSKKIDQSSAIDIAVLQKKKFSSTPHLIFANRVNLKPHLFAEAPLGVFSCDSIKDYEFSFPKGYKKQWRHAFYALLHSHSNDEAKALAKASNNSTIDCNAWTIATESWEDYQHSNQQSILFRTHS